ncbi:hypothetical protein M3Y96_01110900 [Aphelenchoides besseyi]|nr:hypothetical protein M3Y96_01110900 [Aphelenchoides besseyi]
MLRKACVYLTVIKVVTLIVVVWVFGLISSPIPVCWNATDWYEDNNPLFANISHLLPEAEKDQICVKTELFKNIMCAGDPWDEPWWRTRITNPAKFCMARTSTYTSMLIQLSLIGVVLVGHLIMLIKRSFINYDPLDMVPAFFTISGEKHNVPFKLCLMLSNGWDEIWNANNLPVPSAPLRHKALTVILSVGLSISALEWLTYYILYNREQDLIEQCAASAKVTKGTSSDKEHDE